MILLKFIFKKKTPASKPQNKNNQKNPTPPKYEKHYTIFPLPAQSPAYYGHTHIEWDYFPILSHYKKKKNFCLVFRYFSYLYATLQLPPTTMGQDTAKILISQLCLQKVSARTAR